MTQASTEQGHDDSGYEEGLAGGPGAPMPLTQLAVQLPQVIHVFADGFCQGQDGLTARDIQLIIDGGYHTVEAVAYTYVANNRAMRDLLTSLQAKKSAGADQGNFRG